MRERERESLEMEVGYRTDGKELGKETLFFFGERRVC